MCWFNFLLSDLVFMMILSENIEVNIMEALRYALHEEPDLWQDTKARARIIGNTLKWYRMGQEMLKNAKGNENDISSTN